MKKLVMASLLALGVLVVGQQRASAWSEFKFSAGVNLSWTRSGSCTNWGIYRTSTPYDACPPFGCPGGFPYYGGHAAAPGAESYYGGVAAQAPRPSPPPRRRPTTPTTTRGISPSATPTRDTRTIRFPRTGTAAEPAPRPSREGGRPRGNPRAPFFFCRACRAGGAAESASSLAQIAVASPFFLAR